VTALNLAGEKIESDFRGLLARTIQHETDHLDGILFIDRLVETAQMQVQGDLDRFQKKYDLRRAENKIRTDQMIFDRLTEIESTYCS
jgi:peptide deformylase